MTTTDNDSKYAKFTEWDEVDELSEDLLRGIYEYGFERPSSIQQSAVIPLIRGHDIIAQAQSGTGKTGAFSVGTIQVIDPTKLECQALIICPTRELANQNYKVCKALSSRIDINIKLLIGGTPVKDDIESIRESTPHLIVGCPGRIYDMLNKRIIDSRTIKLFVLDEADEMLSRGFKEQIYEIFSFMPEDIQVGLFSATMPEPVHQLTTKFMRDPVKILVNKDMLTLEGIKQYYVFAEAESDKYLIIRDLYSKISVSQGIIYCNSVGRVEKLTQQLKDDGFTVICIHSKMEQKEREDVIEQFKLGAKRILVSSNITARGLDVQQVSFVINYDIPKDKCTYLHRIGRSGRWGRKGLAINFVTERDSELLRDIETYYDTQIEQLPVNYAEYFST